MDQHNLQRHAITEFVSSLVFLPSSTHLLSLGWHISLVAQASMPFPTPSNQSPLTFSYLGLTLSFTSFLRVCLTGFFLTVVSFLSILVVVMRPRFVGDSWQSISSKSCETSVHSAQSFIHLVLYLFRMFTMVVTTSWLCLWYTHDSRSILRTDRSQPEVLLTLSHRVLVKLFSLQQELLVKAGQFFFLEIYNENKSYGSLQKKLSFFKVVIS